MILGDLVNIYFSVRPTIFPSPSGSTRRKRRGSLEGDAPISQRPPSGGNSYRSGRRYQGA